MSTIAANPDLRRTEMGITALLARRWTVVTFAVSGLLVGSAGGLLLASSTHLVHPVEYGVECAIVVTGTVGAALYWARRRPGSRVALVLLAYAGALAGISLQGASNSLLHSVGVLFDGPAFVLGYLAILIFPIGRLVGVLEKLLFAGVAWVIVASFLPWFFFSPVVTGGAPLAGCNSSCPSNALMISDNQSIAKGFGTTEEYLATFLAAAIVAGLSYRLATASRPRARALVPVYAAALLLTIPFGLFHASKAGLFTLSSKAVDTIGWFLTAGRIALTFGFLLAILQAMLFAGVVLKTIIARLGPDDDAGHLRTLVAEALDDPPLELAFEANGHDRSFVDSQGRRIDPAHPAAGRSATVLVQRGETVAYIVHDSALETDPELVRAAGQSILLALESGRLQSELESKTEELRGSRKRIVSAGEAERRKLERDLHDGAQQRLMVIQIKLALARDRAAAGDDVTEQLASIERDAAEAVKELRTLAHGIYPTVLRERGLADSLRSISTTAPITIDVTDEGIGRCSPTVEAAIYFCSLEAIQNAVKHAGGDARVTVTLARSEGGIEFAIADDGVGMTGQAPGDGFGLVSMQDRIGAVGGELEIVSSPGAGTCVKGRVPDDEDGAGRHREHAPTHSRTDCKRAT
jgi:signal transduction histidine kinase